MKWELRLALLKYGPAILYWDYLKPVMFLRQLYCGRVPAANAPRCTAAEGLLYIPWSLVVPTCTARCLHQKNGRWILPENARISRNIQGSFTSRKSTTWDIRLYFPSEGQRAENFFALKNPTASVGFEPANLGTKGQSVAVRIQYAMRMRHIAICGLSDSKIFLSIIS